MANFNVEGAQNVEISKKNTLRETSDRTTGYHGAVYGSP